MPEAKITAEMYAALPPDRRIISVHLGLDLKRGAIFRGRMVSGADDLMFWPATVTRMVGEATQMAAKHRGWVVDQAARAHLHANQPEVTKKDFKTKFGSHLVAKGLEVIAFQDDLGMAFQVANDTYKVMIINPAACVFLGEYLADLSQRDILHDVSKHGPAGSA